MLTVCFLKHGTHVRFICHLPIIYRSVGKNVFSYVWPDVKGYQKRCSFEQGMCSWGKSDLATGWILQKGEQAWPKFGPPRDHTRNTAAGIGPISLHTLKQKALITDSYHKIVWGT